MIAPPNRKEQDMTKNELIEKLEGLLEEVKDYGVPDGMTDEAYFDVVIDLESAIDRAKDDEE